MEWKTDIKRRLTTVCEETFTFLKDNYNKNKDTQNSHTNRDISIPYGRSVPF